MSRHALLRSGQGSGAPSGAIAPALEDVDALERWDDYEPVAGAVAARIPPGQYEARPIGARRAVFNFNSKDGTPRFVLSLRITTGTYAGTVVRFMAPMPSKLGAGSTSRYVRAWTLAAGRAPRRGDRMPFKVFRHRLFIVEVGDVTKDARQRPLATVNVYSVARELVDRIA